MTTYAWVGRTKTGQVVKGQREASSREALSEALRREQILITQVSQAGSQARLRRVRPRNLAIFTRQFSVMIDAGLPLVQCLEMLAREEPDARLAEAIVRVKADVEGGAALAEAMQKQPHAFDQLYTNMIAAGEAGGILDTILQRLATFIEKQAQLISKVRSAMVYPITVLSIALLVVLIILWKVVPTFTALFEGLNATLPLPTQIVVWLSKQVVFFMPVLIAGAVAGAYGFRRYYATTPGRMRVDRSLLQAPVLGPILRKVAVARFCRTLATLLNSGVPILEGLAITARTAGNAVVEEALLHVRSRIERGETIAQPLRQSGVFPSMVVQMIAAGESTGALDTMLGKIADFYEEEVDTAVAGMLTLLEPMLICFLGIVVGGIVISMYLPMFELISQMS